MPTIKTIEVDDGSPDRACPRCRGTGHVKVKAPAKKYRFVVDEPRGPGEKRRQRTYTFDRLKDAEAELARITHQMRTGEFVARSKVTVNEVLDAYLRTATFEKEAATKVSYTNALAPVRARLGDRLAQSIDRDDIEALRDWMLTSGRKRGGKAGTGLGPRSVALTLSRLSAAFEQAAVDRKLAHNPARYVKPPKQIKRKATTWSEAQVRTFLAAAAADRLHAAWRLTLYGLRRGEVLALRWGPGGVDLDAGTVTIGRSRGIVRRQVIEKAPKTERGYRTLPLGEADLAALRALRKRQLEERLAAGEAYADSGYVVTDELGAPVNVEWYSREFHLLAGRAGLPRIRLHDGRGTINSLMAAAGVPDHIRAAWCGHTVAVNVAAYTHARPEDMAVAQAALSKIHKAT